MKIKINKAVRQCDRLQQRNSKLREAVVTLKAMIKNNQGMEGGTIPTTTTATKTSRPKKESHSKSKSKSQPKSQSKSKNHGLSLRF